MRQWYDADHRVYQCRVCNHQTGLAGEPMGMVPKRTPRTSGLLFVVVAVIAVIGLAVAFPQLMR
jgi:hypothetical protein